MAHITATKGLGTQDNDGMTRERALTVLAAVAGMAAGYLAWLGAICLVIVATPVNWWAAAGAGVLLAGIAGAVLLARRNTNPGAPIFYAWSPVLPVVAAL